MTHNFSRNILLAVLAFFWLAACDSSQPAPETPGAEAAATEAVSTSEPVGSDPTAAPENQDPTPVPPDPRSLVVCTAEEPADLYLYSAEDSQGKRAVLDAIYAGPMEVLSYEYLPVILEKIPSLADGDASLTAVSVARGDLMVDADGQVTALEPGVYYRPAGCRSDDCALTYEEESGSVQLDQLSVTFKLLPGLAWSDGTALTAADSVYSFRVAQDPATPADKYAIDRTAGYEALDDQTARWVGLPGYLEQAYFTLFWSPLPEHLWGGESAENLLQSEMATRSPVGWGPFVLESWEAGSEIRMRRNPNYFRAAEGLPSIDELVYRFVVDEDPAGLIASGCDVLDRTIDLEAEADDLFLLDQRGDIQFSVLHSRSWEHVDFGILPTSFDNGWNFFEDPPDLFGDVRTRQGIAYCMDRQAVVDEVLSGRSVVIDSFMSAGHPLVNPDISQYSFDIQAGITLLEEAGWLDEDGDPATPRVYRGENIQVPQGTPLAFRYDTSSAGQRVRTAEILIDSMAQCGILAEMEVWPIEELAAEGPDGPIFGRRFEMAQFAWENDVYTPYCDFYMTEFIPGGDFERFPYFWGGWNNTGFSDPDYDAACGSALTALPGEAAYASGHMLAQEIFAEMLPAVPLYMHVTYAAARADICGFAPDATVSSYLWNVGELDYGDCAG